MPNEIDVTGIDKRAEREDHARVDYLNNRNDLKDLLLETCELTARIDAITQAIRLLCDSGEKFVNGELPIRDYEDIIRETREVIGEARKL